MVMRMSVAFLPLVMSNCCCGSMAWRITRLAQPLSAGLFQLP